MTTTDPRELYLSGYAAFDQGEYAEAIDRATQCLDVAPADSYWHFGSLGLRCWAANYLRDDTRVEQDAQVLLSGDAGSEQPWFEGLALLNLGLAARRAGRQREARRFFARAAVRYAVHEIQPGQPGAWALVSEFFAAVTRWAASGQSDVLDRLTEKLTALEQPDLEMQHLGRAVDLYQRRAQGKDVRSPAETAAHEGVSRAFLALLLLEG